MQSNPTATAPAFEPGRPVNELVVPVVAGSLHDRIMPLAALLAEAWDLPIRLVHVSPSISSVDVDLESVLVGMRSWYPRFDIRSKHLYGDDPAKAIADHASPRTLVLMSTEHIDKWSFKDSVAEAVVERVGMPVLLVGPHVTKDRLRERRLDGEVVVGVDGSAAAEAGVGPAVALAKALGHRLWLVRVMPEPGDEEPTFHPEVGRYLQELAEKCDTEIGTRWEVIQGNDPVEVLEGFAARRDASFLVAATRGRASTERHSMASITAGLAAAAARPVLVVASPEVPSIGAS